MWAYFTQAPLIQLHLLMCRCRCRSWRRAGTTLRPSTVYKYCQEETRHCCKFPLQVSLPQLEAGLAAYYILAMSEASSNLSRYDGVRYGQRSQVRPGHALSCQRCVTTLCLASSMHRPPNCTLKKRPRSANLKGIIPVKPGAWTSLMGFADTLLGGVFQLLCMQSSNLREMYKGTRHDGLGQEVKRRILMGTYALSAGFYDAYYKRAQQVYL